MDARFSALSWLTAISNACSSRAGMDSQVSLRIAAAGGGVASIS